MSLQTDQFPDQVALDALARRLSDQPKQWDNSALPAGSPMFFYCKVCGHTADVLPESYWGRPAQHCTQCQELLDLKYTPTTLRRLGKARAEEKYSE